MLGRHDRLTQELRRSRVRLLAELIYSPHDYNGQTFYHIEIPSRSKFFRVGYSEYVFISLLDGETSFSHALATTAQTLGADALTESQASETVYWLIENGMAHFADAADIAESKTETPSRQLLRRLNPFWMKIPLGCPEPLLKKISPVGDVLFHPVSVALSILLFLASCLIVAGNSEAFCASSQQFLTEFNWLWMLVAWVFLKLIHELAHAMMCHRLGGRVGATGIIFILFAPMAYVDVTSSWRFPSRWNRIAVAIAGMYVELIIASICIVAWSFTHSDFVAYQLFNLVMMAGVSTLLFNANPLMRFDGYFVLSDLLKIPNLYSESSAAVAKGANWLFYGQRPSRSRCELKSKRQFIAIYGLLAMAWRLFICVGLMLSASVLFGGFGIFLSALGVASWWGRPLFHVARDLKRRWLRYPHSIVRAAMVCSLAALLLLASWYWIPFPWGGRNPCVVDFDEIAVVRAEQSGFVTEVLVEDGQYVKTGCPLLRLGNPLLESEVSRLRAELNQRRTRYQIALDKQQAGTAQVERRHFSAVSQRLNEAERKLEACLVTAPIAGRVVARDLSEALGKYFESGSVLLAVGDETNKRLLVAMGSEHISWARKIQSKVLVSMNSGIGVMAEFQRFEPRASTRVPHPALIAPNGGELVVKVSEQSESDEQEYELEQPRFQVIFKVDENAARTLFVGERGSIRLGARSQTLGQGIFFRAHRWLAEKLEMVAEGI